MFSCSRFTAICWPLVQLPPVPHVVSSLRCAQWLHESVNVINVIHYWLDCSSSHCSWFPCRNTSSKAGLLFIYSRGFCDFTIPLASALFVSYWLFKKLSSAIFKLNPLPALLGDLTREMSCDMFETPQLGQVGAEQESRGSSWSFKSFSLTVS